MAVVRKSRRETVMPILQESKSAYHGRLAAELREYKGRRLFSIFD
jgi:hypothetical protein